MSNIVLVGAIDEDLKQIGLAFAQKLDFFYLNCEDMIAYSLFDEEKMKKVCGIKYAEEQEKKVISGLNLYEKTIISMNCETYSNNIDAISQNNIVIYLRLIRAHTIFAGINAPDIVRRVDRRQPACRSALSQAAFLPRKNSKGLFSEGKSDDDKEENRRNTCVFQGSITQSALISTAEKRVCPCQTKVIFIIYIN